MARIAGVNLPTNKRVVIALRYIYGIGSTNAKNICETVGVEPARRVNQLTENEIIRIRDTIDHDLIVEGDLRRDVSMNVKRLMDLGCYKGLRHRKGLPVHGQRTHTNARTRKGPAKSDCRKEESHEIIAPQIIWRYAKSGTGGRSLKPPSAQGPEKTENHGKAR